MIFPDTSTVLVVEDDIAHRLMLTSLLVEWGYRVEEAADGLGRFEWSGPARSTLF